MAVANTSQIYTSTDSGVTWTTRDSLRPWGGVASSSDGTKLAAVVSGGQIYTSTDSGVTWTARESNRNWQGIASSSDGSVLLSGVNGVSLFVSTDSGVTWTARDTTRMWRGFAVSSDGMKMVAGLGGGANAGTLYTSVGSAALPLVFTPAANASGNPYASFTFQVQDDGGTSDGGADLDPTPRTMTVNVTPLNTAPVFVGATTTLSVSVNASATDIKGLLHVTDTDSGQTLTWTQSSAPSHGALSFSSATASSGSTDITPGGTITYTPTVGYSGADSFTVQVSDGTASATRTISVTMANTAPTFVGVTTTLNIQASASATDIKGLLHASDSDSGQTLTWSQSAAPSHGTLSFVGATAAAGSADITPGGTITYSPTVGYSGADSFTVQVSDGTASATRTISVTMANTAPTFVGVTTTLNIQASASATDIKGLLHASDSDSGQTLTWSQSAAPSHGTLSFVGATAAAGSADITPGGTITYTPTAGYIGADSFTVQVSDGSASATRTIAVSIVNPAPTITTQPTNQTAVAGGLVSMSVGAAGFDPLSYQWQRSGTNLADGTSLVGVNSSQIILLNVPLASAGTYRVVITNAFGTVTSSNALLTVIPSNLPPSFTNGPSPVVNEDAGPVTLTAWAKNIRSGPAGELPQRVTFLVTNSNPGLFATQPAISTNGTLTFVSAPNSNGVATVTVQLRDDGGTSDGGIDTSAAQTFGITVLAVNDAPGFALSTNLLTVVEDAPLQKLAGFATNLRPGPADEAAQKLVFVLTNSNNALFLPTNQPSLDTNGLLSFRVAANAFGSATVTAFILDDGGTTLGGTNRSASKAFQIGVTPVNDAPVIKPPATVNILEDRSTNVTFTVSDLDSVIERERGI